MVVVPQQECLSIYFAIGLEQLDLGRNESLGFHTPTQGLVLGSPIEKQLIVAVHVRQ